MKHLDLFSGIGGFALAARWAGIETVGFVEIDPFCQKVLKKHWPEVKIVGDIHEVTETTFQRPVDVITGGFPCQPFSVAGKRKGTDDDRYLWPAMLDVIKTYQPTWVIGENVAGIIGMALEQVLSDLGNAGYETQTFVIPACAVNAPHRRDRVWIIAHSQRMGWEKGARERIQPTKQEPKGQEPRNISSKGITANTDRAGSGTPTSGIDGHRQKESQEQQHWDENWYEVAARFCRVDDGVRNRVDRLKSLGNAIVPQVAYEILNTLLLAGE